MTARIIHHDGTVEECSDSDFFRAIFGHNPRVATAEDEARKARDRLIEVIHKAEYARARREREAIIRDRNINGSPDGETYAEYVAAINHPFVRAANRVNEAVERLSEKHRRAA